MAIEQLRELVHIEQGHEDPVAEPVPDRSEEPVTDPALLDRRVAHAAIPSRAVQGHAELPVGVKRLQSIHVVPGQDTPLDTLAETVRRLAPALVVVSVATAEPFASAVRGLAEVAALAPVWVGGGGASEEMARRAGASFLQERPTEAAARLAASGR